MRLEVENCDSGRAAPFKEKGEHTMAYYPDNGADYPPPSLPGDDGPASPDERDCVGQ
jgi:hypothetical protein